MDTYLSILFRRPVQQSIKITPLEDGNVIVEKHWIRKKVILEEHFNTIPPSGYQIVKELEGTSLVESDDGQERRLWNGTFISPIEHLIKKIDGDIGAYLTEDGEIYNFPLLQREDLPFWTVGIHLYLSD